MPPLIAIGDSALIDAGRIVAVVPRRSAPIERLLRQYPPERVLNLTHGYPRRSVIIFEDGTLALISLSTAALRDLLRAHMEVIDGQPDVS